MIWLSDTVAVLSCAEEIGLHYNFYQPAVNSFRLEFPYQSNPNASGAVGDPDKEEALQDAVTRSQGSFDDDPVAQSKASSPPELTTKKRKRRKTTSKASDDELRHEEAGQRHARYQQLLIDAYQRYTEWITCSRDKDASVPFDSGHAEPNGVDHQVRAADQHLHLPAAGTEQYLSSSAEPGGTEEALDLLALSELKHVVKPKYQDHSSGAGVDVFGTLIKNLDDRERLATAYNVQVVVPRRSRFLISDMTRLQPLLAGDSGHCCTCCLSSK